LKAGTVLTRDLLCVKRPGLGVPAAEIEGLVGRVMVREVGENCVVRWEDVEGGNAKRESRNAKRETRNAKRETTQAFR